MLRGRPPNGTRVRSGGGSVATAGTIPVRAIAPASAGRPPQDRAAGSVVPVHPIERLRYVARAGGLDLVELVQDAALALSGFADDPAALVTACRSLVDRHPAAGPVWWLAARVL